MKNKLLWLTTGTGIAVALFIFATITAGTAYTSTSDSCVNCHEMSTQYMSWKRSTHESISCMACHSGIGVKGYLDAKVGGARKMYKHITKTVEPKEIKATVSDNVCLQCHYSTKNTSFNYDKKLLNDPLLVPTKLHTEHFEEKDITCLTCHSGMVHGSISGDIKIKKDGCVECHNKEKIYSDINEYFKEH
jgi:nitrate/TMAO reductase-like tetraheme cytochrome c subunit